MWSSQILTSGFPDFTTKKANFTSVDNPLFFCGQAVDKNVEMFIKYKIPRLYTIYKNKIVLYKYTKL